MSTDLAALKKQMVEEIFVRTGVDTAATFHDHCLEEFAALDEEARRAKFEKMIDGVIERKMFAQWYDKMVARLSEDGTYEATDGAGS